MVDNDNTGADLKNRDDICIQADQAEDTDEVHQSSSPKKKQVKRLSSSVEFFQTQVRKVQIQHSVSGVTTPASSKGSSETEKDSVPGYRPFDSLMQDPVHNSVDNYLSYREQKKHQGALERLVRSNRFDNATGLLVFVNAVFIGIETDHGDDSVFWVIQEYFFATAFTIELAMRLKVHGFHQFYDRLSDEGISNISLKKGNIFDAFLVVTSIFECFILPFIADTSEMDALSLLRTFRLARMTRLARLFRGLELFVAGVVTALPTIVWAMVFIGLIMYICSIFLVRAIGPEYARIGSPNYDEEVAEIFGTVPKAMYSLFRLLTLDDWWHALAKPVLRHMPEMWIFFIGFIMLCTYSILSVVVAVITERTVRLGMARKGTSTQESEELLRKSVMTIQEVFQRADVDQTGFLSKEEVSGLLADPMLCSCLNAMEISVPDAELMFDLLDIDESGAITGAEFVEGCLRSKGEARAKDLLYLECEVWKHSTSVITLLEVLVRQVDEREMILSKQMDDLDLKIQCVARAFGAVHPTIAAWLSPLFVD